MNSIVMPDSRIDRVLHSSDEIAAAVTRLGQDIARDYAGRDLVLVTALKGGAIFLADLCRAIDLPLTIDFMAVSSYGPGAIGSVRITKDLDDPIEGRDVLMVEDIIDTGLTLNYLLKSLRDRQPASLEVCVLFNKPAHRLLDIPLKYKGFDLPDRFVVGYGLDLRERYRNLPFIGLLSAEALSNQDHLSECP